MAGLCRLVTGGGRTINIEVAFVTHGFAAIAFLLLTALLAASWKRGGPGIWLVLACIATTAWAGVAAVSFYTSVVPALFGALSETLRSAGWILFLGAILSNYWRQSERLDFDRGMRIAMGVVFSVLLTLDVMLALQNLELIPGWSVVPQLVLLGRMAVAVAGVFMVDNLYRNTAASNRWGIRLLCLGVGGLFAYDFFFYADAVLSGRFSQTFFEARGAINALVVPFIAMSAARNPSWKLDVFVSRGVVIHTASLISSGIYLLVMGAVGYYLRDLGGRWGMILQITFWFGAILLLFVIVFSGRFRANLRVLINKHFFNYRYDYHDEWLRFISTISESEMARGLQERVIQALADIVDSPGGILWQRDETGHFVRTARWTSKVDAISSVAPDAPFLELLAGQNWIIDLNALDGDAVFYEHHPVPEWLTSEKRFWLVVPLLHLGDLGGFVVLEQSRAPRALNWEDRDILKTAGQQVASYLAEQRSEKALAEARKFEEFNKKFAFIMHDIKNLASQLSLMVKNADKHAGNPEFQKDMILTVRDSVEKMELLLTRLGRLREVDGSKARTRVALEPLLEKLVKNRAGTNANLTFSCHAQDPVVPADATQLETIFVHLVQNALDAVGPEGSVKVEIDDQADWLAVRVCDDGPGMDDAFVREELFKPFRTTKEGGYGIGAYESRQLIRNIGGRLEVDSTPGRGTTMTVWLPKVAEDVPDYRTHPDRAVMQDKT